MFLGIPITEWLKSLGILLGIPISVFGIVKLFLKDKNKQKQISSLLNMSKQQTKINETLQKHLEQITLQTEDFHKQSLFMIDQNNLSKSGLNLEVKKFEEQTLSKRERIRTYFIHGINSLINPIKLQIGAIQDLVSKLNESKLQNYQLNNNSKISAENLISLQPSEIFNAFIVDDFLRKKEDIELFNDVENSLRFLNKSIKSSTDMLYEFAKHKDNQKQIWDDNFEKLHSTIENSVTEKRRNRNSQSSEENDSFFVEVVTCLSPVTNALYENPETERNLYSLKIKYLEPLRSICENNPNDKRATLYLQYIRKCESSFENIDNYKKFYAKSFSDQAKYLNNVSEILEAFTKQMKNYQ